MDFTAYKKENGGIFRNIQLRQNQLELSRHSAAMAIFLGKNYLGQTDVAEVVDNTPIEKLDSILKGIKDNAEQWAFEAKYVFSYFEAGLKAVYATVEPAVTFTVDVCRTAGENIVSIAEWAFENTGKIWDNLPDIFVGFHSIFYINRIFQV